ncbi:MAG: hypothetical protein RTU30_08585 [Candidatus Thorarchaeota archaeon]
MSSELYDPTSNVNIAIYGRGKDDVNESIEKHFGVSLSSEAAHTWVGISQAKHTMRVTKKGILDTTYMAANVECVIVMIIVGFILSLLLLFQMIMFMIVLSVLGLFSGGAALKYSRVTYITALASEADPDSIEVFTKHQILNGRFVRVKPEDPGLELKSITKSANTATQLFRVGIVFSIVVATLFLFVEVGYRVLYGVWLTDLIALLEFGIAFLLGIIMTDVGALKRRGLRKGIEAGYVDGPLRESTENY